MKELLSSGKYTALHTGTPRTAQRGRRALRRLWCAVTAAACILLLPAGAAARQPDSLALAAIVPDSLAVAVPDSPAVVAAVPDSLAVAVPDSLWRSFADIVLNSLTVAVIEPDSLAVVAAVPDSLAANPVGAADRPEAAPLTDEEAEIAAFVGALAAYLESQPAPDSLSAGLPVGLPDSLAPAVGPTGMHLKNRFLPTARRIDREIGKHLFVYKGEVMLGLTASYGTLSSEDADMFPIFDNINIDGTVASVNPFVGYFYRDNTCVGLRLGYSQIAGTVETLGLDLGPQNDLGIEVPWLDLKSRRFSAGLFHRSYLALDERGRFGAFGEIELSYTQGRNTFAYKSGDRLKHTESDNLRVRALFSPGVAVYAFPNVCVALSFGLGGFTYTHITQFDENGTRVGERNYSKMNFRLNLADIRIGMTIHLWNKRKERFITQ